MFDTPLQFTLSSHLQKAHVPEIAYLNDFSFDYEYTDHIVQSLTCKVAIRI